MLFHVSISADNPERVARVIAELWKGEAFPWGRGWWMAMAGDNRNTAVEVYPRGFVLTPPKEVSGERSVDLGSSPLTATHAAIATPLSEAQVFAVAQREGWAARHLRRGDQFSVIEFWIENAVLFEVLTQKMVEEYLETQTVERWRAKTAKSAAV
jgi:hypothetical protein